MGKIKNIIFDFGDIFINLDKSATDLQLKKYDLSEFDKETISTHQSFEKGLMISNAFITYHIQKYPFFNKDSFLTVWNGILKDFPAYRLTFLKKLKQSRQFKLYLLSNTNALHIDWVIKNVPFYKEFKSLFDGFYLSYEIKYRKPEEGIFHYVLTQNQLLAKETLFIDDTLEHIQMANKLNIQTWHLQVGKEDVIDLYSQKVFV